METSPIVYCSNCSQYVTNVFFRTFLPLAKKRGSFDADGELSARCWTADWSSRFASRSNEMTCLMLQKWQAPRGCRSSWRRGVSLMTFTKASKRKNRYMWYEYISNIDVLICWRSSLCEKCLNLLQKNISRVFWMIWHCKTFFSPQVPLHGRLFAPLGRHWQNRWVTSVEIQQPLRQWMHYAFPRHCGSPRDFWRVILFIFQFGRILSHFNIQISWFGIHLV